MGALIPTLLALIGKGASSMAAGATAKSGAGAGVRGFSGAAAQAWFANGGGQGGGGKNPNQPANKPAGIAQLLAKMALLGGTFGLLAKAASIVVGFFESF